jgi:hemimethylated DNA binding protein
VAEQNLEEDLEHTPIEHPMVSDYFAEFSGEVYEPNWRAN